MARKPAEIYGYDACIAKAGVDPDTAVNNPDCVALYALCKLELVADSV